MDRGAWWATAHGTAKESDMTKHAHTHMWSWETAPYILICFYTSHRQKRMLLLGSMQTMIYCFCFCFFFSPHTGYLKENKTKCWTILKNQEKVLLACSCTYFSHILVQKPHDALHLADTKVLNRLHAPSSSHRDSPRILSSHWEIIFPTYVLMMTGPFPSCCSSSSGE